MVSRIPLRRALHHFPPSSAGYVWTTEGEYSAANAACRAGLRQLLDPLPRSGTVVVDLTACTGALSIEAARLGFAVVAVDSNPLHVECVRTNAAVAGVHNLVAVCADATTYVPPDADLCVAVVDPPWGGRHRVSRDAAPLELRLGGVLVEDVVRRYDHCVLSAPHNYAFTPATRTWTRVRVGRHYLLFK